MEMILLGVVGFGVLIAIVSYNSLVGLRNQARNALSGIDVMLKKRFDMVPNLVATVQQYAKHENNVLTEVTRLRGKLQGTRGNVKAMQQVDGESARLMTQLFAVAESYPQLKADQSFMHLQRTLHEMEEQLSAARRSYNAAATSLNDAVGKFPSNLFAGAFGFGEMSLYAAAEQERQTPNVKNLFSA